jgi:uncharacterized protein YjbJ (UPF0337 family)
VNRDRIKGKIEEVKGNLKKRIGGAADDPKTQAEGYLEEKKGKIREGVGKLEDEVERARREDPDRDA